MLSKRFIKFVTTGVITTLIDFVLFYLAHFKLNIPVIESNIASYGTGIIIGFFINKTWTFSDSSKKSNRRLVFSLLFGYLGLIINTAIVWFLCLYIYPMLAKFIAVWVVLIYNYITNKKYVFKIK